MSILRVKEKIFFIEYFYRDKSYTKMYHGFYSKCRSKQITDKSILQKYASSLKSHNIAYIL